MAVQCRSIIASGSAPLTSIPFSWSSSRRSLGLSESARASADTLVTPHAFMLRRSSWPCSDTAAARRPAPADPSQLWSRISVEIDRH
eukprot:1776501-Rhodomonas_salina.1